MLENIEIKEYPTDFMLRYNCFTSQYCDIAMEALYDATHLYNTMKAAKWCANDPTVNFRMPAQLQKKTAIAIVFSAMAAEAFINDYLAVRLGDDVFRKEYGHSDVRYFTKLEAILRDLIKQAKYKELPWYQDIRTLFTLRNYYVHSTSKELNARKFIEIMYSDQNNKDRDAKSRAISRLNNASQQWSDDLEEQLYAIILDEKPADTPNNRMPKIADTAKRKCLKEDLGNACFALTALCNMTRAIEKLDPNSRAFTRVFSPGKLTWGEDDEKAIRMEVFPKLGLKLKKVDPAQIFHP